MKPKSRNCRRPGFWRRGCWVEYPTFQELKKNLKEDIKQNDIPQLTIFRQRRGEWGEWFETWQLEGEKLILIKKGWM